MKRKIFIILLSVTLSNICSFSVDYMTINYKDGKTEKIEASIIKEMGFFNDDIYNSKNLEEKDITINYYPNPATNNIKFEFFLKFSTDFNFIIYNLLGQTIKTYTGLKGMNDNLIINWDCKSDNGETLKRGFYYFKLESKEKNYTGKILLID